MARIRTIKPEFWSDEKLSECSLSARLLFIGLICHVDDEGRMEFSPSRIRMQVFPCGTVSAVDLTKWIAELHSRLLVRVYLVDGKEYLDIPGFVKHQRVNRPTPSKFPAFSFTAHVALTEDSLRTHGGLTEHSLSTHAGKEGKGMEGNGEKKDSSEPLRVSEPSIVTFPTVGKVKDWSLTQTRVDEWRLAYPHVDIVAECRKALTWVNANPSKRKTATGMPAFLVRWLMRAVDSGRATTGQPTKPVDTGYGYGIPSAEQQAREAAKRQADIDAAMAEHAAGRPSLLEFAAAERAKKSAH